MDDRYDIFYQETLLATIVPPRDMNWRYLLNAFGVQWFEVPGEVLLITCPSTDVRVLKNGADCMLTMVREIPPAVSE